MNVVLKYFSQPSFNYLTFFSFPPTPPIKLKLGSQIGGRLLTAKNHLQQSLWLGNQNQNHHQRPIKCSVKIILLSQTGHMFWLFFCTYRSPGLEIDRFFLTISQNLFFFLPFFFFFFRKVLRKKFPHGTNHKLLNWVIDFLGAPLVV
jgi:hypothetical protein